MLKLISIMLVAIVFEATGVVFLSRGLKEIGELKQFNLGALLQLVGRGVTNKHILLGVFFEALFFIGLLTLMSKADVSFVWPLTSVGFIATTLAAKFFLNEQVSPARWAGVMLIAAGASLVSWTEATRVRPDGPSTVESQGSSGERPTSGGEK